MNEPELTRGPSTLRGKEASERLRSRVAIATAIIEARLRKNWTQRQLAEAAGTKQSRISELEGIQGNPTLETIDRVASALELELTLTHPVAVETQRYVPKQGSSSTMYVVNRLCKTDAFQREAARFRENPVSPAMAARMQNPAKKQRYV